jgi:hypothetical protein
MAQASELDISLDDRLYYRELVRNTIHLYTGTNFETVVLRMDTLPPEEFERFQADPRTYLEERGVDVPEELEVSVHEKNSRCVEGTIDTPFGKVHFSIGVCTHKR